MNNGPLPSADQVGRAVVIAAKVLGSDPIKVLTVHNKYNMPSADYTKLARARMYVALGMREAFPNTARPALAKLLGFQGYTHTTYYTNLDFRIKNGELKWLDQNVIDQIVETIKLG